MARIGNDADQPPHWKLLHKVEASMNGGKIICKSSAALRIVDSLCETTTVFGTVAVEAWTGSPKLFRIIYDGTTSMGKPANGAIQLPGDWWRIRTVKVKSDNAKARLLLMNFQEGDYIELQLTLPIFNHQDSKRTQALVESIIVYGAHFITNKEVKVGKTAITHY
jgi:hypothetical protein